MSEPVTASVIVVSRHRAAALTRCLTALSQQDHSRFEVIVVADPAGAAAVRAQGLTVKLVEFDEANIAAARNLGLGLAAGEVVAFIDDDAVAEPSWLSRLTAPFADHHVTAATGFVRGRNGISFQWRAAEVDAHAQDRPFEVPEAGAVRAGTARRAIKTQGTNCAFRRAALLAIGGFDPAFRFYLDEADVNLRLGARGALTAVVPLAEVHHGFEASALRRADRVPLSLHEIAASTAVFLRRHAGEADLAPGLGALRQREEARIAAHRRARRLDAAGGAALLASLSAGWADGLARELPEMAPMQPPPTSLQPLPGTGPRPGLVIAGRFWQRRRLLARARKAVAKGQLVTVFCLDPTFRAHRMRFDPAGFWLQEGGLFGRSDRDTPRFRLIGLTSRIAQECARISGRRPLGAAEPRQVPKLPITSRRFSPKKG